MPRAAMWTIVVTYGGPLIGPSPLAAGAFIEIQKGAATRCRRYRFFHPPLCPGAPPVERGAGPNSGPDWRESVGWKILLPVPAAGSSGAGLCGLARPGR